MVHAPATPAPTPLAPGLTRRQITTTSGLVVAGLALPACTSTRRTHSTHPVGKTIVYLTGAGMQGREAFVYHGIDQGLYAAEALDVRVEAGAGTDTNLRVLTSRKADVVTVDLSGAVIAYARGIRDFTIAAVLHRQTTSCIMALPGRGITTAKDLAGRRIGYIPGGINHTMFPAYAKLAGIDTSQITWMALPAENLIAALATKRVDAITQLTLAVPSVTAATGMTPVVLAYSDVLGDLYGNALALPTTTPTSLTRRIRQATLHSLHAAIADPTEAGRALARHQPTQKPEPATGEIRLLAAYAADNLGTIDETRVARNIAVVQSMGLISTPISPTQILSPVALEQ
jgi:NitT/TauT family transport system substrate-binding protein